MLRVHRLETDLRLTGTVEEERVTHESLDMTVGEVSKRKATRRSVGYR